MNHSSWYSGVAYFIGLDCREDTVCSGTVRGTGCYQTTPGSLGCEVPSVLHPSDVLSCQEQPALGSYFEQRQFQGTLLISHRL